MIARLRKFLGIQTLEEKIYEYQSLQESLSLTKSKLDDLVEDYNRHTDLYKGHVFVLNHDIKKGKSGSQSILDRIKDRYNEYFIDYIGQVAIIKGEIEDKNDKLSKLLASDENLEKAVKQYELEENFSIVKKAYKLGKVTRDVLEKAYRATTKQNKTKYADCIIRDKEGKFLFLKRNENSDFCPSVLCFPGGHVDPGEKFEEAAKRECEEETGLKIDSCQLVGTYEDDNSTIKYFECILEESENPFKKEQEIFLHGNEHSNYFWLTREEYLKEDLIMNLKDVLEEIYGDEIRKNEIRKACEDLILGFEKGLVTEETLEKAHKYIKKESDGKGGWKYALNYMWKNKKELPNDIKKSLDLLEQAFEKGLIAKDVLEKAESKYGAGKHVEKVKVQGKDGKTYYRSQEVGRNQQDNEDKKETSFSKEQLDSYAKETPKEKLESIIKNSGNSDLREAAHRELKRRTGEEEIPEDNKKDVGGDKKESKVETKKEQGESKVEKKEFSTFKGNIEATVEKHKEDIVTAKDDLKRFTTNGTNTLSDKTIDTLAILGSVTTPKEMIDLMRDKDFQSKVMKDLELATGDEQKKGNETIDHKDLEVDIPEDGGTVKVKHKGKDVAFDDLKLVVDGKEAFIPKVKKKEGELKGVGTATYIKIGQELDKKGVKLIASDAMYADGQKMWHRLVKQGYAKKVGNSFEFVNKDKVEKSEEDDIEKSDYKLKLERLEARHTEKQYTKEEADYVSNWTTQETQCEFCHYWTKDKCNKVIGEIQSEGHCKFWEHMEVEKSEKNSLNYTKDQLKELIKEHEGLVELLSKYKDKEDIKEELDKQIKELGDYKKQLEDHEG